MFRPGAEVAGLVVAAAWLVVADAALGASIISPADRETVVATPLFVADTPLPGASLDLEVSHSPDLRTTGNRIGWFVDPADTSIAFFGDDPLLPNTTIRWKGRLDAGLYYWRGLIETYDGAAPTWTPVQTFTVRDEPAIIEGWTLRITRLRSTKRCSRMLRVRSTVAASDNDRNPQLRSTLTLRAGATTRRLAQAGARIDRRLCTPHTRFAVSLSVRDRAGHATRDPTPRAVRVT